MSKKYEEDELLTRIERASAQVRADGKPYTDKDVADELGISQKTVQRKKKTLAQEGRLLKKQIPYSQQMRDEIFERHVDTFEMIRRAILRTERQQQMLDAELGFEGDPCECCGRPSIRPDFLKWQTAFAGGKAMNDQITTLAKMLGQISDNQLVLVQQIDDDVSLIMSELARVDRLAAQRIYNALIQQSIRRKQRMPEFVELIEGESRDITLSEQPEQEYESPLLEEGKLHGL